MAPQSGRVAQDRGVPASSHIGYVAVSPMPLDLDRIALTVPGVVLGVTKVGNGTESNPENSPAGTMALSARVKDALASKEVAGLSVFLVCTLDDRARNTRFATGSTLVAARAVEAPELDQYRLTPTAGSRLNANPAIIAMSTALVAP
jgi:hypothetical protein